MDGRLYVPERWFGDDYRARRKVCGLPTDLQFQTEPELALAMLVGLLTGGHLPFRWITADEHFGEIPDFLEGIAATGKWYQIEVPVNTQVWLQPPRVQPPGPGLLGRPRTRPRVAPSAPRPLELRALATQLPRSAWHRWTIKEASRGPLESDFAFVRVTAGRNSLPGPRLWATYRRALADAPEIKCYLSNAPTHCPPADLGRVTGLRWPIETALEEGKGEIGQDHYICTHRRCGVRPGQKLHQFVLRREPLRLLENRPNPQPFQQPVLPQEFPKRDQQSVLRVRARPFRR